MIWHGLSNINPSLCNRRICGLTEIANIYKIIRLNKPYPKVSLYFRGGHTELVAPRQDTRRRIAEGRYTQLQRAKQTIPRLEGYKHRYNHHPKICQNFCQQQYRLYVYVGILIQQYSIHSNNYPTCK